MIMSRKLMIAALAATALCSAEETTITGAGA